MRLYHRTWAVNATNIIEGGFKDGAQGFVWLSSVPLESVDISRGNSGDICLGVFVPDDVIAAFPMVQRDGYIAYKIPAETLNMCNSPWVEATNYSGMTRISLEQNIASKQATEANQPIPPDADRRFGRSSDVECCAKLA